MGESPKVLQVTFGSFSCTLEGFEDPVQTLFTVAEHFRDLAERDPGFARGTRIPDAATLARQVEAAGGGTGAVRIQAVARAEDARAEETPALSRAPAPPAAIGGEAEDEAAAEVADFVRVVAAVAEGARTGAGRLDIERLAAALAATRRAAPRGSEEARDEAPRPAVTRTAPGASAATGFHDWGADEEEELAATWRDAARAEGPHDPTEDQDGTGWSVDEDLDPEGVAEDRPRPRPSSGADGTDDARRLLSTPPDQDEAGLLRILSLAERQLADPGVTRRREAMAHLKAAVAATEAQRAMGRDGTQTQDATAQFRDEWAAVARPQGTRGERPAPPPLRLVASQRVDLSRLPEGEDGPRPAAVETAEDRTGPEPFLRPVTEVPARSDAPLAAVAPAGRPAAIAAPSTDISFAAFAAQAGATGSLPDLLEAAASWLQVVRREDEVSRSQLLALVAEVLPEPPEREDALRVFGALLRQGRLSRVEGGRFRVGAATRFGPARHAV